MQIHVFFSCFRVRWGEECAFRNYSYEHTLDQKRPPFLVHGLGGKRIKRNGRVVNLVSAILSLQCSFKNLSDRYKHLSSFCPLLHARREKYKCTSCITPSSAFIKEPLYALKSLLFPFLNIVGLCYRYNLSCWVTSLVGIYASFAARIEAKYTSPEMSFL